MPARLAVRRLSDPIRVRLLDVIIGGVRIRARDYDHAELPAAGDEFTEWIAVAEPGAPVVKSDIRGVIRNAAAGAQADGVGMGALKIIEPEGGVEFTRVVLDQRELCPAHRFVGPGGRRRAFGFGGRARGGGGRARRENEITD